MKEAERLRNFFPAISCVNLMNPRTTFELFRKRNQTSRWRLFRMLRSHRTVQAVCPGSATRRATPAERVSEVERSSHNAL